MTNVLPIERLRQETRRARAKFMLTGALVLSIAAIAGIVALFPAFFVVYFSRAGESSQENVSGHSEKQRKSDQEVAGRIRALLKEAAILSKKPTPASEAIAAAYTLRPKGIVIGGVAYVSGDPSTITLVGTSKSRDDVGAFRDALTRDKRFEKVSVPVAALVGALEGNFTVTLTGKF